MVALERVNGLVHYAEFPNFLLFFPKHSASGKLLPCHVESSSAALLVLDVVPVNFVLLDRLPTLVKRFLSYCLCW